MTPCLCGFAATRELAPGGLAGGRGLRRRRGAPIPRRAAGRERARAVAALSVRPAT